MDPQAFFWRVMAGELPPPRAVQTLGGRIVRVDAEAGIVETTFQAPDAFANPMGHVQGGFLAANLTLKPPKGPVVDNELDPNRAKDRD